ncbi:hypothetical protein [Rhodalgimonas zhirmunskyi]|uniref:Uncharacterized protein n=1 Tax=Rhodalgimonas zhirmunskyi TaxID=2964767 RepID=A0AAJ1X4N2_9RHOB|nr:hypothetical protein [Rhodoalgimonas zhirmunskyi]MDQ2093696.1 hypothetical protein [Rhodoalgimonas zhirmunskyi]
MLPLIHLLNFFGGVVAAAGILWCYLLFRKEGLADVLPASFDRPMLAIGVAALGFAMLITGRILTAFIKLQVKRLRAQGAGRV